MSNWTFGRKLGAGFAIAAVALAVVGVVGHRSIKELIEDNRWVSHTYQVRREISALLSQLRTIDGAVRGYVITGDESHAAQYQAAHDGVAQTVAGLGKLIGDNPTQSARLQSAGPPIEARLATGRDFIAARRTQGAEAAARLVVAGAGTRSMEQVQRILGEMDQAEADLLVERMRQEESSARAAQGIIMWGSLSGVALVALAGLFISRSLSRQVGEAVRHIQSSSAELQAAANQQAASAKEQATATAEIITTINELLATSRQIADSAQRVSQIAGQTATSARTGDGTVDRGHESVSAVRRQVELIVNHMLELGKKSQQIGAVLEIVAELAEQTNILAINASIEAAGAGDAGKRFAVVADEIRKLADRVGGSTKEIRGLIDDVRSAVNTSVMTTETGSKAAEAGSRQFAEVASAFRQISTQVTTTTEAAREIELSTKQQASAVEQVNVAMSNVAQSTKENEVSTAQTLRTASELARLSRDLLRLVQPQVHMVSSHQELTS
jgi:CHASE3 domain sensor protein